MEEITFRQMFKNWLLKFTCLHEWNIHSEIRVFTPSSKDLPSEIDQTLLCVKCGKFKKITL